MVDGVKGACFHGYLWLGMLKLYLFLIMTSKVDVHYQARTTEVFNLNECVIQEIQFLDCTPIAQYTCSIGVLLNIIIYVCICS